MATKDKDTSSTTCCNCKFWDSDQLTRRDYDDPDYIPEYRTGECRRHAPTPMLCKHHANDREWEADWDKVQNVMRPITAEYTWCGEFKSRRKK